MHAGNYYAVLHVPEDADAAAIRHAYRILVRRFHPDAGIDSSAQKFRDVTEAYAFSAIRNDDVSMILIWLGAEHIRMCDQSR